MEMVEMTAAYDFCTSGTAQTSLDICPSGGKVPLEVSHSRQMTAWMTANNVVEGSVAVSLVATASGIRSVSGDNWRVLYVNASCACCRSRRSGSCSEVELDASGILAMAEFLRRRG